MSEKGEVDGGPKPPQDLPTGSTSGSPGHRKPRFLKYQFCAPLCGGSVGAPLQGVDGCQFGFASGPCGGQYSPVDAYGWLGDGKGSFNKVTETHYYGWRPRTGIILGCSVLLFVGALLLFFSPPPISGASPVRDDDLERRKEEEMMYDCDVGQPSDLNQAFSLDAGLAIFEAGWRLLDVGGDDMINWRKVSAVPQVPLSSVALQLAEDADVDGDGLSSKEEFLAALKGAGMETAPTSGNADIVNALSIAEATWLLLDQDGNEKLTWQEFKPIADQVQPDSHERNVIDTISQTLHRVPELNRDDFVSVVIQGRIGPIRAIQLEDETVSWSSSKRSYCCKSAGVACDEDPGKTLSKNQVARTVVFNCQGGRETWKTSWTVKKKQWCCEHGRVGCE